MWDFGLIEHVLRGLGATSADGAVAVEPAQELLDDAREAIRVARVGERVVVYLPRTTAVKLKLEGGATAWNAVAFDLENKRVANLPVMSVDDAVRVAQHPFEHDALLVVSPAQ